MQRYQLYINGEWVDPASGAWLDSTDPFSGDAWCQIPRGGAADVDAAVEAAHQAFASGPWPRMSATQRGAILRQLAALLEANAEHIGRIEQRDNGKLITEVLNQARGAAQWFYYYAGLADKVTGQVVPMPNPETLNLVKYEPLGVIAAITPWNSPLTLTSWKVAPALAAGNVVVIKPSEFTSASLLEFARLCGEAGLPPGVVNVVTGYGAEVGEPLVRHRRVAKVAFTGGDAAGQRINEIVASDLKKVTLELGGKSANIVYDDADMEQAVMGAVAGIFSAAGQTCMAGSRLLLQDSIHDAFVARLRAVVEDARIGDPRDAQTQIGPIATRPQFDKILSYIDIATSEGARCIAGGGALTGEGFGQGQFVAPTIFVDVLPSMRIAQEEVFGPVLSVLRFKDEEEAVRIANDVQFGLAGAVWTRDLHRAMWTADRLQAGTVWVNNYRATSFTTPFGGYKRSGIGREGGIDAIKEYLQTKSIWVTTQPKRKNPFVMGG
ncbi:aldehyde dehydrogenase [Xenophilus azovorans]|uniref:aldehyde dehydrogenase n=1 Tax=Xenophilus azovorans TaxID=151755 RepID=UPI000570ED0E|nr:aldehyde dehydrogenase [Xenophilus azovorans]